jgi:hypothetical protein
MRLWYGTHIRRNFEQPTFLRRSWHRTCSSLVSLAEIASRNDGVQESDGTQLAEEQIMRRRISFSKRALAFEALEQKRPLAVEVLSCGEADPDAVVAEDSTQHAAKSADLNHATVDENENNEIVTVDDENELENEKFSNDTSGPDESAEEQADDQSDELDDDSSDDDDDESMMDDTDEEDDESDENDSEEGDSEEDEDEEDEDEEDEDEEDEDEEDEDEEDSDEDNQDDLGDGDGDEDEEDDDSDEKDDESDEVDDDMDEDDDDSDENDHDDSDDEDEDDGHDVDEADDDSEPMQSSIAAAEDTIDDGDVINTVIAPIVMNGTPSLLAFRGAIENGIQSDRSIRSSERQLADEDLIELLQVQPGNPSRDGRELVFDEIIALASDGMVEPAAPFINDELARATLQGSLQPAFVDAVFTSID